MIGYLFWYLIALGVAQLVLGLLLVRRNRVVRLRHSVFASLDDAMGDGINYVAVNWSPDEIAYDMTLSAPGFIGERPETLTPYIREWLLLKQGIRS